MSGQPSLRRSIALAHDAPGYLAVARLFEIERDRTLSTIQRGEILAEAVRMRGPVPEHVAILRLDLDDVGPHIGQEHSAKRAGSDIAEFGDEDARKGPLARLRLDAH
jgi:hypothetical protein